MFKHECMPIHHTSTSQGMHQKHDTFQATPVNVDIQGCKYSHLGQN